MRSGIFYFTKWIAYSFHDGDFRLVRYHSDIYPTIAIFIMNPFESIIVPMMVEGKEISRKLWYALNLNISKKDQVNKIMQML